MSKKLSHLDKDGAARMVDVSAKSKTAREAQASGAVRMKPETLAAIREANIAKGDVLGAARLAAIMAAKRTAELIPLCHLLPLDHIGVDFEFEEDQESWQIIVSATARTVSRTGVEMEALVAVSTACLTIYDMAKAIDREMIIENIRLLSKSGGKSGDWRR